MKKIGGKCFSMWGGMQQDIQLVKLHFSLSILTKGEQQLGDGGQGLEGGVKSQTSTTTAAAYPSEMNKFTFGAGLA